MNPARLIALFSFVLLQIIILKSGTSQISRDTLNLSLKQVLNLSIEKSLDIKSAESSFKENQLNIQRLQEQLKPRLFANAVLPSLNRAIESRPTPDGQEAFFNRATLYNSAGVQLNYNLIATGGVLSANSSLDRLDVLKTQNQQATTNYLFSPISVSYRQPFFQFNELKWQREQYDFLSKELTSRQVNVREAVAIQAIQNYTQAYQAQINLYLITNKISETNALLEIKNKLASLGKVQKSELLRLQLEKQSNQSNYQKALIEWEKARLNLCDFLQLDRDQSIYLLSPPSLENIYIDPVIAVKYALENSFIAAQNTLRIKNAETDIKRTNMDNGIDISLDVSIGLNKSDSKLSTIYQEVLDKQNISLTLSVPLNGSKERALNREIATEQLYREKLNIEREATDISRQVIIAIKELNLLVNNIELEKKRREVAEEIYNITRNQYTLGDRSITELNVAQSEQEEALRSYYQSILDATAKYYEIRKLCLFDFINNKNLIK